MKAIDIENVLKSELVNKQYNGTPYPIVSTILNYLKNNGFDTTKIYSRKASANSFELIVSGPSRVKSLEVPFLKVSFKKKMKDKQYVWGSSCVDWRYADFSVSTFESDTVEESCKEAVSKIQRTLNSEDAKLNRAVEIFEFLQSKGCSSTDAIDLVKTANDNRWDLARRVYRRED